MTIDWTLLLSILSLVIGFIGTYEAIIQHRSKLNVEKMAIQDLTTTLNRIKWLVPYKKTLDKLIVNVDCNGNKALLEWIWIQYKGLSDLYLMIVTQFLNSHKTFTHDDIKRLVDNGIITTEWEETVWRNLISERPENSTLDQIPPRFINNTEKN
jgi:hypothetical protein